MSLTYLYSPVHELSDEHYKLCLWHNMHGNGEMQTHLVFCRKQEIIVVPSYRVYKSIGYAALLWDDNEFIGWAFRRRNYYRKNINEFAIYIKRCKRRKGYGRILYSIIRQHDTSRRQLIVHPWDEVSAEFFKNVVGKKQDIQIGAR